MSLSKVGSGSKAQPVTVQLQPHQSVSIERAGDSVEVEVEVEVEGGPWVDENQLSRMSYH